MGVVMMLVVLLLPHNTQIAQAANCNAVGDTPCFVYMHINAWDWHTNTPVPSGDYYTVINGNVRGVNIGSNGWATHGVYVASMTCFQGAIKLYDAYTSAQVAYGIFTTAYCLNNFPPGMDAFGQDFYMTAY